MRALNVCYEKKPNLIAANMIRTFSVPVLQRVAIARLFLIAFVVASAKKKNVYSHRRIYHVRTHDYFVKILYPLPPPRYCQGPVVQTTRTFSRTIQSWWWRPLGRLRQPPWHRRLSGLLRCPRRRCRLEQRDNNVMQFAGDVFGGRNTERQRQTDREKRDGGRPTVVRSRQ